MGWYEDWKKRKGVIVKDLQFCQELMNRIVESAEKMRTAEHYEDKHTALKQDIIRLRRELNDVRIKCDPYYDEEGD